MLKQDMLKNGPANSSTPTNTARDIEPSRGHRHCLAFFFITLKPGVFLSDLELRFVRKACGSKDDALRIEFALVALVAGRY
jgi:hypothetical protein